MTTCQFGSIASRQSVHHTDCTAPATYEAVDILAPALERVQRPVCAGHARFLHGQGFWIFPQGDDEAQSLDLKDIVDPEPPEPVKTPDSSYGPSASQGAVRARLVELERPIRKPTRVLVPANTPPEKIDALKDLLARKRLFDPAWNGERFEVATHEHECASVECDGEVNIDGAILLSAVNDLLFGEGES